MKSYRPWLWILLLVPLALGLARLRFDVEVLNLLPGDLPAVQGLKLYQQNFSNARELIITVRARDAETAEASARAIAERLRAATNLTAEVTWQPPWIEHPGQSAELVAHLWLNQPPEIFGQLTNRLATTNLASTISTAREQLSTSMSPEDIARLSYDPFGLTRLPESAIAGAPAMGQGQELFASADGTFRIIFAKAKTDLASYRDCLAWLNEVKALVEKSQPPQPAVTIHYTGRPAFVAEIAGGMERDMTESVLFTAIIIAILFWIAHRRWVPMLWLLTLLALILAGTLALGGLIFGDINVVSLGFAAILLGLAVDYGVVHYQEALASPNAIIPEIRRAIGPSIFWAAVTTISAFLVLNFGGLPGLAQLGSLVAVGVALSALVMLFAFLPPLFRDRIKRRQEQTAAGMAAETGQTAAASVLAPGKAKFALGMTTLLVAVAAAILFTGWPRLDNTANALRPRHSPAYDSLEEIKSQLTQGREPLWVVASGRNEAELAQRLDHAERILNQAVSNQFITGFNLPTPLWPRPGFQAANRATATQLVAQREMMRMAAVDGGFSPNAFALTDSLLDTWQSALAHTRVFWPTNQMSRWILEKLVVRRASDLLVVGFVYPPRGAAVTVSSVSPWADALAREGFLLSGWELLGGAILQRVQGNLWRLVVPMAALVLFSLWLAFRRPTEILLSLAVLFLSGLCLLAVMRVAGWSWNLLNLMALPLVMGTGVDYSIFMQLALRRHDGDLAAAHRSVGRALLLCGATAMAGFGSLAWSSNAGMASLGQVCAVGVGFNMLISIYLLPVWWRRATGEGVQNTKLKAMSSPGTEPSQPAQPSALYQANVWQLGLMVARLLPASFSDFLARSLARTYWLVCSERREIVIQNLLPLLDGNRVLAGQKAKELFLQFGRKLADLWRYEAGQPVDRLFGELTGWEHFVAARATGRGILLVTPHLGNWEFGAPLLGRKGVKLVVLTQAEPGSGLTEMRQAARARWGVETIVVGQDAFAFVEIIKRLDAGATVALLIDRPPPASAVEVELFGRPFKASIAAAELARASGCVVLPVYLPRAGDGYEAHILPEICYDRPALRDRTERQKFTQQILRAFAPAIRQHADQWHHFIPIWPRF